jgi:Na+/proline symporter
MQMRTSKVMLAVIGVAAVLYTLFLVAGLAQDDFRSHSGMVFVVVGLGMAIIGLLLSIRRPREGFIVGMLGTGLAFLLTWWLFPFYIPLPIILGYRLIRWQDAQQVSAPGA